jgi:tetratricopeptide (TPR) repeat protein/predicted Ser/Thr protein kinase
MPPEPPSSRHLEPERAAHYAANLLEPAERAQVDEHIDGCGPCRELLSAVAKLAWSTLGDRFTGVPVESSAGDVLPRGTRVGHFELEQPLGAGGMGVVYLAFDSRLDRQVALKCVRDRRTDPKQLLTEARLMAQLAHPNVVPVYDVVEAHGQMFIAMELVPGRTLRQWTASARTWQQVVDAFLEAGEGLSAAHEAGIIHGDVKPGNILVGNDQRVRVTDFGLASVGSGKDGTPLRGTEAYLAPEQRAGAQCDQRCDQYAFAVSLHEALFGALPGERPTRRSGAPASVKRVLERALSEDPAARFPAMRALLTALRSARRAAWRFVVAALATLAIIGGLTFALGGRRAAAAQCDAAAAELASPWTTEARARTREAFKRTGVSYADETLIRVESSLNTWQHDFERVREAACSSPYPGRQLACLADAAQDARALITQLVDADVAVVLHAVAASQQLASAQRCVVTRPLEPARPSAAANEVRERIARARATAAAGKYREALPLIEEAAKAADASGELALRASSRALLGGVQGLVGKYDEAAVTLPEAIRLAELAQDDRARALAWADLVQLEYLRGHHDQVILMSGAARGACERINDVRLVTDVMGTLGASLSEKGDLAQAKVLLEEAVRLRADAYGPDDRRTSAMLSVLANTLAMAGDLPAALSAHQKALAAAELAFGPSHPEAAIIRQNLGDDYLYGLQGELAVTELSKAIETLTAANGPKAREVAIGTTDLGLALWVAGRNEEAVQTFARAMAVWSEVFPKHPSYAIALLGHVQAQQALGQPFELKELEQALELSGELPPFERGRVLLGLGLAVSDAKRARALVLEARQALGTTTLPLIVREQARAEAWLSAHP